MHVQIAIDFSPLIHEGEKMEKKLDIIFDNLKVQALRQLYKLMYINPNK